MQSAVVANQLARSIERMAAAAQRYVGELAPHPMALAEAT
jgi:hypothetical protein